MKTQTAFETRSPTRSHTPDTFSPPPVWVTLLLLILILLLLGGIEWGFYAD